MLGVAAWSLIYALRLVSADLATKLFWAKCRYLAIVVVPPSWLAFVLQYTGRGKWLTRRNVAILAVVPVIAILLAWTNDSHYLFWSEVGVERVGTLVVWAASHGPGFWVYAAYAYLLFITSTFMLVQVLVRSPRLYRLQVILLLFGALSPLMADLLSTDDLIPFRLDLAPYAFTITGLAVAWGMFRFRLFDIVPVARSAVVDGMSGGVLLLDGQNRVVDINPAAGRIFGHSASEVVGRPFSQLLAGRSDLVERYLDVTNAQSEITLGEGRGLRSFDLCISPLNDRRGNLIGRLVVLNDITERVRAEAELRRYQERLEELVEERTTDLRESEERYRTLFDGVPVGLYRTTPQGQIVDANLAMVQMLGYPSREHLLPVDVTRQYVNPDDRMRWRELVEREGILRDFETQLRRYDGQVIWVNLSLRAVKDEWGQVLYYEGSLEDITERKRAEAELRRYQEHLEDLVEERTAELRVSEERYRTLFDGVPVGLYRTTPEGDVLDDNLAIVQMLGYQDIESMPAGNVGELYIDPGERARWQALMEREGVVSNFEMQLRRRDGTVIWVSDTARAVKDEQGQVLYYEGSLKDITERKEFEEEIRRQKDYFEALFINSPVAVVTADLDGDVVSWNPMAEKLFGYTQAEAIGRKLDDLVAADYSLRAEAGRYTAQVIDLGRVQVITKRTRKDGSLVDVDLLALPLVVAGQKVGFIAIYHDITPLQEARRGAEAANRAKSAFLANMSHELRTPLNAVLGFTQLMGGDPNLTAEQRENLGVINRSGEHLLALINDVLEMSKIEAGRVTLQEKSFDLYHLLDGLEEMFGLRARYTGLALRFERAEDVPQYVRTDEGKLRQVMVNLLGNAVKFTQEGSVTLRVNTLSRPQEGQTLHFEVKDTGPGIAPDELAAVFDPFVQATSGQQVQEGTGLGLSISQQYVHLMGGDITVSSELGAGSIFRFDVQVGLADAADVQLARPRRRVVGLEPNQCAPDGAPYRLLVVEDREVDRQLLLRWLTEICLPEPGPPDRGPSPLGFEVREAASGQEAIEIWERWQPHLIWMDMRMPGMDGCEATRRIKAMPKGQSTVVIALTASAFEQDRERMLAQGCDDFVRKPFRSDEIFEMLAKHLGVRFVYEEQRAPRAAAQPADVAASLIPALADLPAGWVADLQKATARADLNRILIVIDQIRGQNAILADTLTDLASDFKYREILALLKQAGG